MKRRLCLPTLARGQRCPDTLRRGFIGGLKRIDKHETRQLGKLIQDRALQHLSEFLAEHLRDMRFLPDGSGQRHAMLALDVIWIPDSPLAVRRGT